MSTYNYAEMARLFREEEGKTVDDAVATIRRTVKLHGPRLIQEEISQIQPNAPVDRGTYRRSWKFEDIPGGATVYNFTPYAAVIEDGRRPGAKAPPLAVIQAWLLRKGIVKGRGKTAAANARAMAFVVARAIKRRGLPGRHILRFASQRLDKIVQAELARERIR